MLTNFIGIAFIIIGGVFFLIHIRAEIKDLIDIRHETKMMQQLLDNPELTALYDDMIAAYEADDIAHADQVAADLRDRGYPDLLKS